MLRNFAAALLATTLIAGPAFAAQPARTIGAMSPAPAPAAAAPAPVATASKTVTNEAKPAKTVKTAKRTRKHVRKHVARHGSGAVKHARHVMPAKTHQTGISHKGKAGKSAV